MGHMGKKRQLEISDEDLIDRYMGRLSVNQISQETGLSTSTIYRVLERHGVKRTGLENYRLNARKFDPVVEKEIRTRYEAGEYFAQLVERFGGTFYSIKAAIRRAGGTLIPVTPSLNGLEKSQVLHLRKQGFSQQVISLKLGRSQSAVSRFLRSQGEVFSPRRGEAHGMWRGGRMKASGYWRVLVDRTDPMAVMCGKDSYVMEHRLVMARKLGRPLLRSETIHHIDGDRLNNSPDNLQLRQGRHGKHIVMRCNDCGSHNIGPAPLG